MRGNSVTGKLVLFLFYFILVEVRMGKRCVEVGRKEAIEKLDGSDRFLTE